MPPARLPVLAALLAGTAAAQTMGTDAPPAGGAVSPAAGEAARLAFDVRAEVESPVAGCPGFVSPGAPDAVVEWGGGDLRVWTRAAFDATLLVARPDGTWACNDDAEGTSPVVEVGGAAPGRYAVWVGSLGPSPADARVALYAGAPPRPALDAGAPAAAGDVEAAAGFEAERGGIEIATRAGGADWAGALGSPESSCWGFVEASRPTARVRYRASDAPAPLVVSAAAPGDELTVLVRRPDGAVACSGDAYYGPTPTVVVEDAAAGDYAVWVGTAASALGPVDATLSLSETVPEGGGFDGADGLPFSEGTYTPLDLTAPPARLALDGDAVSGTFSVAPAGGNPVEGPACTGRIEPAPTAALVLAGEGPVAVTATDGGATDLVLVLRTPGGAWLCSDDADGTDPGIQVDDPEGGAYLVWVGTFGGLGLGEAVPGVEVTVEARRGTIVVSGGGALPEAVRVEPQSPGAYGGDAVRPGGAAVVLGALDDEADVLAGGPVLNPVEGAACAGFLSVRPTAEVAASGPVAISATADADLTLAVRTAGGAWACSDDADGTDPRVEIDMPGGAVSVWVGTFSRVEDPRPARLRVERAGE